MIEENPYRSVADIANELGISSDGVRYHINKLRREGILRREGPDKGGKWVLSVTTK